MCVLLAVARADYLPAAAWYFTIKGRGFSRIARKTAHFNG
jgi:hypothetical protein